MPRELSTRYIGWCPVCERDIKVRDDVLVHHGYQRPGVGYIIGDCVGVGVRDVLQATGQACRYALRPLRVVVARSSS